MHSAVQCSHDKLWHAVTPAEFAHAAQFGARDAAIYTVCDAWRGGGRYTNTTCPRRARYRTVTCLICVALVGR